MKNGCNNRERETRGGSYLARLFAGPNNQHFYTVVERLLLDMGDITVIYQRWMKHRENEV